MRWGEIDLEEATWFLPAERTKAARAHSVPLSGMVVNIMRELPKLDNELIFPARGSSGNAFSGFSKAKIKLDVASGVREWRLHDLRRTLSTAMAGMQVRIEVVERLLNHSSGRLGGVAGIYNRFDYFEEMRAAVELWAQRLQQIAGEFLKEATCDLGRSPSNTEFELR
jgi:integrase